MASLKAKNVVKYCLQTIAVCITISFLLACLTPFVNPVHSAIFTLLSLGFPVLLLLMLIQLFVFLFINKKLFLFILLILALDYKNIVSVFAFHLNKTTDSSNTTLKVLSWNVDCIIYELYHNLTDINKRQKMLEFIKASNADILCLQDNTFTDDERNIPDDIKDITKMGYPYHILSNDYCTNNNSRKYGTSIFSKYPIARSGKTNYKGINYESLLFADILINNKPIRVFTTHLRSMVLKYQEYFPEQDYKMIQQDTADILYKSVLHKIIYFDKKHVEQAFIAKQVMDTTKIPFIFCADLNSVPSSFVYHHIAAGLKDIFLQTGWGFGQTYSELSPTLRIDVMLTTPDIKALNYTCPKLNLSDHYPILATLMLPENYNSK